jgi:hypothetical protein
MLREVLPRPTLALAALLALTACPDDEPLDPGADASASDAAPSQGGSNGGSPGGAPGTGGTPGTGGSATDAGAAPGGCVHGGCSNHLCVEASAGPVGSTCEFRPEYACYAAAKCERQVDGRCGFTPSETLTRCLMQAGAKTCSYGGKTYAVGDSFPATDGCNTCSCGEGGSVACTKIACPQPKCDFAAKYEYGQIGGFVAYTERSYLSPGNAYRHQRTPVRSDMPFISCAPAMPMCGAADVITAYDVEVHDLRHPDVQAALARAKPPLYGRDQRPVDGTVFEFVRADGRGFLVGADCPATFSSCQAIPAGIKQLRDRLLTLDRQQLANDECRKAGFSSP